MIIKPLTKIMVTSSQLKCKPGSFGYVVRQSQHLGFNIWDRVVLFSRLGKTGKDRLEMMRLSGTMIDYKSLRLSPKGIEMLKNVTLPEGLHPRLHISDVGRKKPKHSHLIDHTQYDVLKEDHKDVLNMPVWEFMSYITAMSALAYSMAHGVISGGLADTTLGGTSDAFYDFPDNMPALDLVWLFLMYGLKLDQRQKNKEFESRYREFFESQTNKVDYMTQLRQALAMMSDQTAKDTKALKRTESSNRRHIKETLQYYKSHTSDYRATLKRSGQMISAGKHPDIDVKEEQRKKVRLRRA